MSNIVNYISSAAIPVIIISIILYGLKEKNNVFDTFIDGAKEGIEIVFKLFPTLIGIFLAVGALRSSGLIEFIVNLISPVVEFLKFPSEVMPLALLRPISGSASMAVAVDIMQNYGVDTLTGIITSTIMGSTETTFYTIAIYTSCVGIKKTRGILFAALAADMAGMIVSTIVCRILSWSFCWQKLKINVLYLHKLFHDIKFKGNLIQMILKIICFFLIFNIIRKILIKTISKKLVRKIKKTL